MNSQPLNNCSHPIADRLFIQLGEMYGHLWIREYGDHPSDKFCQWAEQLNGIKLNRIHCHARERFATGDKFPPVFGEIIVWGESPTDNEYTQILNRVMARQYENEIEHWIVMRCLYDLRRKPQSEVMRYLRDCYRQALDLQRRGELFKEEREFLELPPCSGVSVTDQAIADYKRRNGVNPFQNRINKLLKGRK